MTVNEAITRIDALKPNEYDTESKVRWLNDLDNLIIDNIHSWHEEVNKEHVFYDPFGGLDDVLLVHAPYDDVYVKYLAAQVDYYNAEFGRYNNSVVMFNLAYSGYSNYINRTYMPIQRNRMRV